MRDGAGGSSVTAVTRRTRRLVVLAAVAVVLTALTGLASAPAVSAAAPTPPSQYGDSWDNPRTPEPPVAVPATRRCTERVVDHPFADFDVYHHQHVPPASCPGPWSKVVLRLDGSVAGRQFDRLGYVDIGGVRALTLSTPEPSAAGIHWHVEKDVTDLSALLEKRQDVSAFIGNVVDTTYTGVLDVTVDLDFYATGPGAPAADVPDAVLPLADPVRDGTDLVGSMTLPRNATRLLAAVDATGSGGGCEEFWDTSAPTSTGYSCSDGLPYREVDVSIDGRLAGVAAPYAVVYTGGWSNPFLWYTTPSPKAFDIPALGYDLTPFVGTLTDGRPHQLRVHVVGLPDGQSGWTLSPSFRVWRDAGATQVTGGLTSSSTGEPKVTSDVAGTGDGPGHVDLTATRSFTATGWVRTSTGRVTTTVQRALRNTSAHVWTDQEGDDTLHAAWRDTQTVTATPAAGRATVTTDERRYAKDGTLGFHPHAGVDGAYDVTGDLAITWHAGHVVTRGASVLADHQETSGYDGTASWVYGVPREDRHGEADTRSWSTVTDRGADGSTTSYQRRLHSVNGVVVADRTTWS
ncbi:hypothetical protein GCM10009814_40130 [Lapillicoccus jejuensis]|uniref:Peptide N-acetyl-beta-D-glucosaminyl asparaginase amidase A n=1 Tax=Lapillicoccus jejuensis TaxID=402171 RepID=A0A542E6S4_9MICO|nr:peptide N-acetyl-beta-D-glucosaminyl asparaginase amidase A [Lapillicoccus jejuensis]